MKILVLCEHGNVRSVSVAYLFKTLFKADCIAYGAKSGNEQTMLYLSEWADKIVLADSTILGYLPSEVLKFEPHKLITFQLGEDIWHKPFHQGLMHKIYKSLAKHPELWINEK